MRNCLSLQNWHISLPLEMDTRMATLSCKPSDIDKSIIVVLIASAPRSTNLRDNQWLVTVILIQEVLSMSCFGNIDLADHMQTFASFWRGKPWDSFLWRENMNCKHVLNFAHSAVPILPQVDDSWFFLLWIVMGWMTEMLIMDDANSILCKYHRLFSPASHNLHLVIQHAHHTLQQEW